MTRRGEEAGGEIATLGTQLDRGSERHIMGCRLHGAKRAAAERGELRVPLSIGYLYNEGLS